MSIVCLSVHLSVCLLVYLKNHTAELHQIFLHVGCDTAQTFHGSVICNVCVLPVLWMVLMFSRVGPMTHYVYGYNLILIPPRPKVTNRRS